VRIKKSQKRLLREIWSSALAGYENTREKKMEKSLLLTIASILTFFCLTADAGVVYSFKHIVENGDGPIELADGAIGESQLFVSIDDFCAGQVLFTFTNIGPHPSSITGIYFDDGILSGIASIDNSCQGVLFSPDATPHNLPGGQNLSPPFVATESFSVDSVPPVQPNGVNPDEWLGVVFNIQPGYTYNDVKNSLISLQLRIGLQVQGFASGGGESFVNIPEPITVTLLSAGLSIITLLRRRRTL